MNKLEQPVLVLNKGWSPVGTISVQKAITLAYSEYTNGEPKAMIIDPVTFERMTWSDWSKIKAALTDITIRSVDGEIRIPEIILLSRYEKLPLPKSHFSRRTLYKRDNNTCQYCLKKFATEDLTIDHIQPKSRGGQTTWENCCLACVDCNSKKADRTPQEARMKLHCVPKRPKSTVFKTDLTRRIKSWSAFIGESYWSVELDNDNQK